MEKQKLYPECCIKTPQRRTQPFICQNCYRYCIYAGKRRKSQFFKVSNIISYKDIQLKKIKEEYHV